MKQWLTQDTPGGVHVLPLDDLIVHEKSEHCTCAPVIIQMGYTCWDHGGKAAVRRRVDHHAMDGRD